MHRISEAWEADADVFRPERWLEKDGKAEKRSFKNMNRKNAIVFLANQIFGYAERYFFAFGGGTRSCLGLSK